MSVCLKAGRYRQPHGQVSIMVMVVGEHRVNFLRHEEGRFTMRELFGGLGERGTNRRTRFRWSSPVSSTSLIKACFKSDLPMAKNGME